MGKSGLNGVWMRAQKQHVLILASGDTIRHMTVRPWMAGSAAALIVAGCLGYLGATSYLVMRDSLIGASTARQARMQHEYEDRISALRAQVDRVTSRQLLDQQVVEDKLQSLLEQQMALSARSGKLGTLLDRADDAGLGQKADLGPSLTGKANTAVATLSKSKESVADHADRVFQNVTLSLKTIEQNQQARIHALTAQASEKADAIRAILDRNNIRMDTPATGEDAMGGPLMAPDPRLGTTPALAGLDGALNRLETAQTTVKDMPFSNPAPTREITSPFGNRTDPLLGRLALHPGIDFRAANGAPIKSAGAGTVVLATEVNGYGNMVEIDHGQGVTTRYGHMSRFNVRTGEKVEDGQVIGFAGSTGRSTGPHLHYEIRRNGTPVNPMSFLVSGLKLDELGSP
ncbi:murein DD-endopeptidase MepM/ murein hydrolase activator NlpD [Agrobacterium vitis]|nr:murein DD-endopeptidase MepM/ murein hydrolase activator NlpD [Agrobacterium vitis]MBE1438482.1 murein DD-endopeptidase MepM/ murein hydrolase activator NlpD [Agrobacterium vitis]